mmetsp:Transcript_27235/g.70552  ORF Transcript_27235/g.70552 Transcript_27235/m.70552 type:complete len:209 (-) Transcript_27235:1849-2475(-)
MASSKCFVPTAVGPSLPSAAACTASRIAQRAARFATSAQSAPLKPGVHRANKSRSTSSETGEFRSAALKTAARDASSGSGMYTNVSRRPGRVIAASRTSGLFVAPMTKTSFRAPTPSISVRIWLMTRSPASEAPPWPEPRCFAMASISSKKRMHGADARAFSKRALTLASDSPNHIVKSSGPLMDTKFAPHSWATAWANKVLPHPGGP